MHVTCSLASEYTARGYPIGSKAAGKMVKVSDWVKDWGALSGLLVATVAVVLAILSLGSRIDSTAGEIRNRVDRVSTDVGGRVDALRGELSKLRETVRVDQEKLNKEVIPRLNNLYKGKDVPEVLPTPQLAAIMEQQQQMLARIQELDRTTCGQCSRPSFATLLSAHPAECNRVGILLRLFVQRLARELLPDGLLHDGASDGNEVVIFWLA